MFLHFYWLKSIRLIFITCFYQGYVQRSGNSLFENVFQIFVIAMATEQSIKSFAIIFLGFSLTFKSTFTIEEFMNDFWNDLRRTPHDGCFC